MFFALFAGVIVTTRADHLAPEAGVKPLNVLGGPDQHASFSFIRPGLTQTSYSFNGPSSHQSFSSSIGNPDLSQKVYPSIAQALAYRNPGLGKKKKKIHLTLFPFSFLFIHLFINIGLGAFANAPISGAYASPTPYNLPAVQPYQDPAASASPGYFQPQDYQGQYQAQLAQLLASRQAQLLQLQQLQGQAQSPSFPTQHQVVILRNYFLD